LESGRLRELKKLSAKLGLKFNDLSLLNQALTHSSFQNESGQSSQNNQRLEYLGDSVLELIVNEFLYKKFPSYTEGQLAKIKSHVVSERSLAKIASQIGIGSFLLVGKGEFLSGGKEKPSILADALEALIASIYLDQGLVKTKKFVIASVKDSIDSIRYPDDARDPKSRLQEMVQALYSNLPVYSVLSQSGPDHDRIFTCGVSVNGVEIASGRGNSKKQAEKNAAIEALKKMKK